MIVLKIGGSLEKNGKIRECLGKIKTNYVTSKLVIVPGGGSFADQVRFTQSLWLYDGETAHEMALLAMKQMAWLLHGLMPCFPIAETVVGIRTALACCNILIWSPDSKEMRQAGVESSWSVTSDSLAAWLANELSADQLVLIKSAKIGPDQSLDELQRKEVIDRAFVDFVKNSAYNLSIINYEEL